MMVNIKNLEMSRRCVMPFGDGTGPSGMGSMTGRGAGFCAGYNMPGYANRISGYARFSRGGGRGHRNWYYATGLPGWARAQSGAAAWGGYRAFYPSGPDMSPEKEAEILKNRAQMMQDEINAISERITELEQQGEKKKT
jgi:hypothetical protein